MNVLLQWKMPRAYKIVLAHHFIRLMWRGVAVGVVCVLALGTIALNYLSEIDELEAKRAMLLVLIVAAYLPIVFCMSLLSLIFPTYYKLTPRELKKRGDRVCWWEEIENYTIEPSEIGHGLQVLEFKVRARKGKRERLHEWIFDQSEVEQSRIVQVFEEQMAECNRTSST